MGCGAPDGIPDVEVEVEVTEADLRALLCRELRPLRAYVSGRLKVKGDLAVTMKLEAVLRTLKQQPWLTVHSPAEAWHRARGTLEEEALALHRRLLSP